MFWCGSYSMIYEQMHAGFMSGLDQYFNTFNDIVNCKSFVDWSQGVNTTLICSPFYENNQILISKSELYIMYRWQDQLCSTKRILNLVYFRNEGLLFHIYLHSIYNIPCKRYVYTVFHFLDVEIEPIEYRAAGILTFCSIGSLC